MTRRSPISIRARTLLHSLTQGCFLVATLSVDDGSHISTTKGAGWVHLLTEYSHRGSESRKGGRERHTSQGRFWLRQYPPHNDQGTFPPYY